MLYDQISIHAHVQKLDMRVNLRNLQSCLSTPVLYHTQTNNILRRYNIESIEHEMSILQLLLHTVNIILGDIIL